MLNSRFNSFYLIRCHYRKYWVPSFPNPRYLFARKEDYLNQEFYLDF